MLMLGKIGKLTSYIVPIFFAIFLTSSTAHGLASTSTTSTLVCGSTDSSLSTLTDVTANNVPAGTAYLKLNYQSNPINLTLYAENYLTGTCNKIGGASINANTWVDIGKIISPVDGIIIQGDNITAAPYQAAAQLLILQNNSICQPSNTCNLTFADFSGTLQLDASNIVSDSTDQIAIYAPLPVIGQNVKSISYYADNQRTLVYSSDILKSFNRNYLDGGVHQTQIQIKLADNQSIFVNETVNMGTDWTGILFLKSLIYRYSGQAAVFIIAGIFILLLLILLAIARFIYKTKRTNKFHGINNFQAPEAIEESENDNIFVG
jgi:hypothetical protein